MKYRNNYQLGALKRKLGIKAGQSTPPGTLLSALNNKKTPKVNVSKKEKVAVMSVI